MKLDIQGAPEIYSMGWFDATDPPAILQQNFPMQNTKSIKPSLFLKLTKVELPHVP
jgi:hypothetical protein